MPQMCKRAMLLGLLVLIALPLVPPQVVRAIPPLPFVLWGEVKVNGTYVPSGTVISVWANGSRWAEASTSFMDYDGDGIQEAVYQVNVPGDDPETVAVEGPTAGTPLQFHIQWGGQDILANETAIWQSGGDPVHLDLTGTGATPTPSPTRTNTPTPSITPSPSVTPTPTNTPPVIYTPTPTPTCTPNPAFGSGSLEFQRASLPDPQYNGAHDAWISAGEPTTNHGGDTSLEIDNTGTKRILLYFDVSLVPQGAHIVEAKLTLRSTYQRSERPLTVAIYGLKRDWVEGEATWVRASALQTWALDGADDPTGDRTSTAVAYTVVSTINQSYYWDVTSLAQAWVNDPAANHGMLLIGSGEYVYYRFASSEANLGSRPKLYVRWEGGQPPATPAPTSTPGGPGDTTPVPGRDEPFQYNPPAYTGVLDTYIDKMHPTTAHGSEQELRIKGNADYAAALRFDISRIPAGARVYSATLQLNAYNVYSGSSNYWSIRVGAYGLKKSWTGQATWLTPWTGPGATDPTSDRDGAPAGRTSLRSDRTKGWYTWDVTTLAQRWVDHPDQNFGLLLWPDGGEAAYTSSYFQFRSSEYAQDRPRLRVLYSMPTPTPRPTSTPTNTPTPTATSTPAVGTLQVTVFNDVNRDGIRGDAEPGLSGARIEVWRGAELYRQGTTGSSGACTFASMPEGSYVVHEVDPPGYVSSTVNDYPVDIVADQQMDLYFGDYLASAVTATPTATPNYTRHLWLPLQLK